MLIIFLYFIKIPYNVIMYFVFHMLECYKYFFMNSKTIDIHFFFREIKTILFKIESKYFIILPIKYVHE